MHLEMQLHAVQVKQIKSYSSPSVITNSNFGLQAYLKKGAPVPEPT